MTQKKVQILVTSLAATAVLLSGCATTGEDKVYPYPFDSAHIEYELAGNVNGTITVLMKDGKSSHETAAIDQSTPEAPIATKLIDAGEYLYQIDLNTKQGQKAKNPIYEQLKALPMEERMDFLTKLAVGVSADGEMPMPVGEKAVAGETCDVYEIENFGETCLWNGIPLYSRISIPEAGIENTNTATSIQINANVPDSAFEVPEDVTITEVE